MVRTLVLAILAAAGLSSGQSTGAEYFETKVRPIFAAKCQACHGLAQRMAGLDLSSAAGFLRGATSGPLVTGSDPSQSRLMRAIGYQGQIKMPPAGKLAEDEIASVREWVRIGSPWPAEKPSTVGEAFWSFQPVRKVTPPKVGAKGVRNPIDAFLLARLEAKKLQPAPPADKLTLIRRATYDLTGLPPAESEIRDFLEDRSPEAFARVVERLLASPRYGERWGRHWLDVARYGDSTGGDEDFKNPHAWRYRDYVIEAFNRDLPYDQFIREQLAGDLLPAEK